MRISFFHKCRSSKRIFQLENHTQIYKISRITKIQEKFLDLRTHRHWSLNFWTIKSAKSKCKNYSKQKRPWNNQQMQRNYIKWKKQKCLKKLRCQKLFNSWLVLDRPQPQEYFPLIDQMHKKAKLFFTIPSSKNQK